MIEQKDVMAASKTASQSGTSQQLENCCAYAASTMKHQLQNNGLF
tara:strand:+ start:341 stop:475 length:135 start_codon:yes stop_codon:yes gene_type:complete